MHSYGTGFVEEPSIPCTGTTPHAVPDLVEALAIELPRWRVREIAGVIVAELHTPTYRRERGTRDDLLDIIARCALAEASADGEPVAVGRRSERAAAVHKRSFPRLPEWDESQRGAPFTSSGAPL